MLKVIRINARRSANLGTRSIWRNSRRSCRQSVTHSLGRNDTLAKQKGADFEQWLKPRQIALRPLLWEVCCNAYTRFNSSYEAAHDGKRCFEAAHLGNCHSTRKAWQLSDLGNLRPFLLSCDCLMVKKTHVPLLTVFLMGTVALYCVCSNGLR